MHELLADAPAASAILDRLLHHAETIPINNRGYWLKKSATERRRRTPGKAGSAASQ